MSDRHDCSTRLWQGGVPVTAFGLILLLTIVSVIITGAGLHSAFVWLILMAVCILCFTFCNCVKCKKRASLWRRSSESADTISTISDGSSIMNSIYPLGVGFSISTRRDSPPSYSDAITTEPPPPPYSTLIHTFTEAPTINRPQTTDTPPPYISVIISTVTDEASTQQEIIDQRPSINSNSISIISGSDIMRDNKNVPSLNVIQIQDIRTVLNNSQTEREHLELINDSDAEDTDNC